MMLNTKNIEALFDLFNPETEFSTTLHFEGYSAEVQIVEWTRGFCVREPIVRDSDVPSLTHSVNLRASWIHRRGVLQSIDTVRYDHLITQMHIASLLRLCPRPFMPVAINPETTEPIAEFPIAEMVYVQIGNDNLFGVSHPDTDDDGGTNGTMRYSRVRSWSDDINPPWVDEPSCSVKIDFGNVQGSRELLNYKLEIAGEFTAEIYDSEAESAIYANLSKKYGQGCVVAIDLEEEKFNLSPVIVRKLDNMCILTPLTWITDNSISDNMFDMMSDENEMVFRVLQQDIGNLDDIATFHN